MKACKLYYFWGWANDGVNHELVIGTNLWYQIDVIYYSVNNKDYVYRNVMFNKERN